MHASLTKDLYFTTSTVVDWVDVFTRPTPEAYLYSSARDYAGIKGLLDVIVEK